MRRMYGVMLTNSRLLPLGTKSLSILHIRTRMLLSRMHRSIVYWLITTTPLDYNSFSTTLVSIAACISAAVFMLWTGALVICMSC